MKYRVIIEQDEDGMFVAEVPFLPGCISQASIEEEIVEVAMLVRFPGYQVVKW